jgi:hypothetical protein
MAKKAEEQKVIESKLTVALKSPDRFKLLPDGWIQDSYTGLDWSPSSESIMYFKDAVKYAEDKGGRLPEIHELHSLVDFSKSDPASYEIFKDMKHDDWYWSNTPRVNVSWKSRWCVSFGSGGVYDCRKNTGNYVRAFRSSQ